MSAKTQRTLRRAYLEWVEERVEEFKDSIPRSKLLAIADEVVEQLRVTQGGQYQLTELLLCNAMDRHLKRMLKLPGYRAWCAQQRAAVVPVAEQTLVIPFPAAPPAAPPPAPGVVEEERVACVV